MSTEIKFTPEELEQIKEVRDTTNVMVYQFGEIDLELSLLRERIDELEQVRIKLREDYRNLRNKERTLVDELNTKYGTGQLDIESGLFQPIK
jgi:hypothetical protein